MVDGELYAGDMIMRPMLSIIAVLMLLILPGARPVAQVDSGPVPESLAGFPGPPHGKTAANIENLRLLKLLETVDLSEAQSEQFLPVFYGFRKDMKEMLEERKRLVERIAEQVKSDASDDELNRSIQQLLDLKNGIERRRDGFLGECRAILSTKQLARLVIFQEQFERDLLESLREFRRHGLHGPGDRR